MPSSCAALFLGESDSTKGPYARRSRRRGLVPKHEIRNKFKMRMKKCSKPTFRSLLLRVELEFEDQVEELDRVFQREWLLVVIV
jgi:hypothetical protein